MTERILNVKVGESLASSLAMAAHTMTALEQDKPVTPYVGIGFSDVGWGLYTQALGFAGHTEGGRAADHCRTGAATPARLQECTRRCREAAGMAGCRKRRSRSDRCTL